MRPDAPYFIIRLCLTPDDLVRHGEIAVTQWISFFQRLKATVCRLKLAAAKKLAA
jgi:hypothetical protein